MLKEPFQLLFLSFVLKFEVFQFHSFMFLISKCLVFFYESRLHENKLLRQCSTVVARLNCLHLNIQQIFLFLFCIPDITKILHVTYTIISWNFLFDLKLQFYYIQPKFTAAFPLFLGTWLVFGLIAVCQNCMRH